MLTVAILVAGCGMLTTPSTVHLRQTHLSPLPQGRPSGRPNIVFILTDDLSWNLVRYMPQVLQMERDGMTFDDYTVTDSLCCPSRATIFTGDFPHDTRVFTNTPPAGGFVKFHRRGEERRTYAALMQRRAGYRTGMFGKYLNGYEPFFTAGTGHAYIPPGWSSWNVVGNGYHEFNYHIATDQGDAFYGSHPEDYLTQVIADRGVQFVRSAIRAHTPFVAELSTFAPHRPYVPAPRDAHLFKGLRAPRGPAWNRLPTDAPSWLGWLTPMKRALKHRIDRTFRRRVQSVQAVDRMIAAIRAAVDSTGAARNTYLVFSSDNGYHMGEHRLGPGKQTAFDTDVRVPLIIVGPGVPRDVRSNAVVQNTDLAPTFDQIAGIRVPRWVDGHGMLGLWHGRPSPYWRDAALIEHRRPVLTLFDPDRQTSRGGVPPSYDALRTTSYAYVEYRDGAREYYDLRRDPYELHNTYRTLGRARRAFLHAAIKRLEHCHGRRACWAAGHLRPLRAGPGGTATHRHPPAAHRPRGQPAARHHTR
jgi:arylsulfatase A-like enzyme